MKKLINKIMHKIRIAVITDNSTKKKAEIKQRKKDIDKWTKND